MVDMTYQYVTHTVGYGLSACVDLAKNGGAMSASSLAGEAGVSASYMRQVLNKLRTGRVLTSTRGRKGGYRLSRSANRIRLGQIIESLEGPPPPMPENIPWTVRRHWQQARRGLHAIRLSDL